MSLATPITDTLNFEWNVFEQQFLQWHQMTPEPMSSENISYTTNTSVNGSSSENDPCSPHSFSPDDVEIKSDKPSKSNKSSKQSPAYSKRRSQNREAQRAFRARQRQHTEALEEKLKSVLSNYELLQQQYTSLSLAYEVLLKDKELEGNGSITCSSYENSPEWLAEDIGLFDSNSPHDFSGMMIPDLEAADERT